jgi:hypothetical protein
MIVHVPADALPYPVVWEGVTYFPIDTGTGKVPRALLKSLQKTEETPVEQPTPGEEVTVNG